MTKLDMKKQLTHLYGPSANAVSVVDVPAMNYLAVDGRGDPNRAPEYAAAVEALFSLSYALEGLWWAEDMDAFSHGDRSAWQWTMMIMQPEMVTAELAAEQTSIVGSKKVLPSLTAVRFEAFTEGPSAQIMHVGPFSAEGPTIERLHRHIADSGHTLRGKHHEIYLTDIRRADPAKWRTIIRQPFA